MQLTSKHDWEKSHEHRHENSREKTGDNTSNPARNMIDKANEVDVVSQVVKIGDETNNSCRNGPKNNQRHHERNGRTITDYTLPPLDAQIRPDNLGGVNTDITRCHV